MANPQPLAASSPADIPKMRMFHQRALRYCKKDKSFTSRAALHRTPPGFTNWRDILANLVLHSACLNQAIANRHYTEIEGCIAAKQALIDDSPLRHIDRELAEAFLRTRLSPMEKPPMAFEHMMINLPQGLLVDDWGVPITAILVSTWSAYKNCCQKAGVKSIGLDHAEGLEIVGLNECGNVLIDTTAWANMGKPIDVRPGNAVKGWEVETQEACLRMQRIAVHTLLVMAYKPELVSTEAVTNALSGSGFKQTSQQQSTRDVVWIGKNFHRASRVRQRSDDTDGAPKAPHWRAGHWHTVCHGKGRQERRIDWFQPVYVNASATAA